MTLTHHDKSSGAELKLVINDPVYWQEYGGHTSVDQLTIAWNTGRPQKIVIDGTEREFQTNAILPLITNQGYNFSNPEDVIAWQFNRDFYCIANQEVNCAGLVFYGRYGNMFLTPDEDDLAKITSLFTVFKEEFKNADSIQGEMLRMLLVRLIINITRFVKQQYGNDECNDDLKFDLYRKFNLMVEVGYKEHHEVKYYASALNKSPKTLANVFAIHSRKAPSQIIYERIVLEAKRLLHYTDKSIKEIYLDLGFEDASHFGRFFKKVAGQSPSDFRSSRVNLTSV